MVAVRVVFKAQAAEVLARLRPLELETWNGAIVDVQRNPENRLPIVLSDAVRNCMSACNSRLLVSQRAPASVALC